MDLKFGPKDALLLVDLQYDFLPDGALQVQDGDKIIPLINTLIESAQMGHATIIASRDWHPTNHVSFKEQGGPWPAHCVQNTHGAELHEGVHFPEKTLVVSKAFKADHEAYSAFHAETSDGRTLVELLNEHNIQRLIIGGLALDYCVKASALDAIKHDFETVVVKEATRAINEEDGLETIRVLKSFGVKII